jgi:RNA polymerase sigma-70 factor (ECF subfamily)
LNTVTANTAIDYYRKLTRQRSRVNGDGIPRNTVADQNPENCRLDSELVQGRIHDALEAISVNQRTAFVLRYYEDMPIVEIARTLGCSEGAVRTHIRRSLIALRARLTGKIGV